MLLFSTFPHGIFRSRYTRQKDPSPGKKKISQMVECKGNKKKLSSQPPPSPLSKGAYEIRKGEEHLKKQLAKKNSHL
jgi:hypothetical protein